MKAIYWIGLVVGAVTLQSASGEQRDPMTAPPPPGYYTHQKVLYQNDGGFPDDHAYFERFLRNISAHITATGGNVEILVVDYGPGVKLFTLANTDKALASSIDSLRAKGVQFKICRNTLRGMGLQPGQLYHVLPADVVPSGVAEIARLQGLGYVFEHP